MAARPGQRGAGAERAGLLDALDGLLSDLAGDPDEVTAALELCLDDLHALRAGGATARDLALTDNRVVGRARLHVRALLRERTAFDRLPARAVGDRLGE